MVSGGRMGSPERTDDRRAKDGSTEVKRQRIGGSASLGASFVFCRLSSVLECPLT